MKIYTTFLFVLLLATTALAQVSSTEKQALLDLYQATDGNNWNNTWDIHSPVSNWYGVSVSNNKVVALDLKFNNLKGELPTTMNNLVHIENIELSFNQISGTLPENISDLKQLKMFAINSNQIEGNIPNSFGSLNKLQELHISSNQISGNIPATLGNLNNLITLNVFDNNLTGTLPYAFSESKNLKKLIIAENELIVNENLADVVLFEVDNENTLFKTPNAFANKTVIAIETSDDDN